jgi:hypothetical protein
MRPDSVLARWLPFKGEAIKAGWQNCCDRSFPTDSGSFYGFAFHSLAGVFFTPFL